MWFIQIITTTNINLVVLISAPDCDSFCIPLVGPVKPLNHNMSD
jgi:hypothetical protein